MFSLFDYLWTALWGLLFLLVLGPVVLLLGYGWVSMWIVIFRDAGVL